MKVVVASLWPSEGLPERIVAAEITLSPIEGGLAITGLQTAFMRLSDGERANPIAAHMAASRTLGRQFEVDPDEVIWR